MVVLLLSAASAEVASSGEPAFRERASHFLDLLAAGDTARVAARLHYPPSYTTRERAEDEAAVREQLSFLLKRFGRISQVALAKEPSETVDIGVSGGTADYLNSLGTFDYVDVSYSAMFEREGRGMVKVAFLRTAKEWVPWRISLCLPTSRPDARALSEQIAREMASRMREIEL
jgi:hypothetical protein